MTTEVKDRPAPTQAVKLYVPSAKEMQTPTGIVGLQRMSPFIAGQLNKRLPTFLRGNADRLVRALFTCVQRLPKLMDCTPISLFGGVIQAGELGLELGPSLGQAYLIPYKDQATFVLGYKGAVTLVHRSGQLKSMTPQRIRAGDEFYFAQGSDRTIIHKPLWNNRGPVTGYYVVSEMTNGGRDFEIMSVEEAVEFRDRYSSTRSAPDYVKKHSPWYDTTEGLGWSGFDQMACKTLMKRLAKRLPVSVEFQRAAGLDDMADAGVPQRLEDSVEMDPTSIEGGLRDRLNDAKLATPLQEHAKKIEECDTWDELNAAIQAAVADKRLSDPDRNRLDDLAEERKFQLENSQ